MTEKTNCVIVVDFNEDNNYLVDQYLLGQNNIYDGFDIDTTGDEIIKTDGTITENDWGLIEIDSWTMLYGSIEPDNDLRDHCEGGNNEGINCTVCLLKKDSDGEWIVIPI